MAFAFYDLKVQPRQIAGARPCAVPCPAGPPVVIAPLVESDSPVDVFYQVYQSDARFCQNGVPVRSFRRRDSNTPIPPEIIYPCRGSVYRIGVKVTVSDGASSSSLVEFSTFLGEPKSAVVSIPQPPAVAGATKKVRLSISASARAWFTEEGRLTRTIEIPTPFDDVSDGGSATTRSICFLGREEGSPKITASYYSESDFVGRRLCTVSFR